MELYRRPESRNWYVAIPQGGSLIRRSTGETDREKALVVGARIQAEVEMREKIGLKYETLTVENAFRQQLKTMEGQRKRDYAGMYQKYIRPAFAHRHLETITQRDIMVALDDVPVSRQNRLLVVWRALFKRANYLGYKIQAPEVKTVREVINPRDSFSDDEITQLLHFLEQWQDTGKNWITRDKRTLLYWYVCLLLGTGMRPGKEALGLRWWDFQSRLMDNQRIKVVVVRAENSKVRKTREAVLDSWVESKIGFDLYNFHFGHGVVGRFEPSDRCPMFANRRGEVPTHMDLTFLTALQETGLLLNSYGERRSLYSLRHWYITKKLSAGKPIYNIAHQCGNSVKMIEKWYSKVIGATNAAAIRD